MGWLKDHAWMANWLAVVVAIVIASVQGLRAREGKFNWARLVIYFGFLSSFAIVLTPAFDTTARVVAELIALASFAYIIAEGAVHLGLFDRKTKVKRNAISQRVAPTSSFFK